MRTIRVSAACFLLVILVTGCGSDYESVRGTVTLDGAPLANCQVVFHPVEGGRPAAATTDENGKYELASSMSQGGVLPGSYTVDLTTADEDEDEETGGTTTTDEQVPAPEARVLAQTRGNPSVEGRRLLVDSAENWRGNCQNTWGP